MTSLFPRLIIVTLVGLLAYALGDSLLLADRREQLVEVTGKLTDTRQTISWYNNLKKVLERSERRTVAQETLEKEISRYLLEGESDRLRMTIVRDDALKALPEVTIFPAGGSDAPARISFNPVEDLAAELEPLKRTYQRSHPDVPFQEWGGPRPLTALAFDESYRMEASYDVFLQYLAKIETAPTYMEVTGLQAEGFEAGNGEKQLRAQLTVTSLALPQDASGGSAPSSGSMPGKVGW